MESHFAYEGTGKVTVVNPNQPIWGKVGEWTLYKTGVEIKDVKFLTPARVTYEIDGKAHTGMAFVNIANREAYHEDGTPHVATDQIFSRLDVATALPHDFFGASDEIRRQAAEAQSGVMPQ